MVVACLSLAACTATLPNPDHEFHNYQTAVAHAPQQGWTPYWLGRSFDAGGLHFTGPTVADFGDEIPKGGISASYDASHGAGELEIICFNQPAWQDALSHGFGLRAAGSEQNTVTIAGGSATVTTGSVRNNGVRVDTELETTHILAVAGRSIDLSGHDTNPLNDASTLVAVLQHIRPYPQ